MWHCDNNRFCDHKLFIDDERQVRRMALQNVTRLLFAAPKAATVVLTAGENAASGFDVTTIMSESVATTQTQIFSVLAIVVPAIVAVTAAIVGIKFGIGWLRKIKGN